MKIDRIATEKTTGDQWVVVRIDLAKQKVVCFGDVKSVKPARDGKAATRHEGYREFDRAAVDLLDVNGLPYETAIKMFDQAVRRLRASGERIRVTRRRR